MNNTNNQIALAVDTSGRNGSVAVGIGDRVLAQANFSGMMRHNAELFTAVRRLLAEIGRAPRDIEHVYLCIGPGSFTGLRIAATMAKMLSLANGSKIVTISTMDSLAQNIYEYIGQTERTEPNRVDITRAGTIVDAKRGRFFAAVFEKRGQIWSRTTEDHMISAAEFVSQFADSARPIHLAGEGLVYYRKLFETEGVVILDEHLWYPSARCVYELAAKKALAGEFADAPTLVPSYIRQPDAVENLRKNQGQL